VAVGAEEFKISEAVIDPIAVDGMKLHAERFAVPLCDSTPLTRVLLEAGSD
jgi:hypothetical protein